MNRLIVFMILSALMALSRVTGFAFNELMDMGFLLIAGYILSGFMERINQPWALGYIIAGFVLGGRGIGLVNLQFAANLGIIKNVSLMVLIVFFTEKAFRTSRVYFRCKFLFQGFAISLFTIVTTYFLLSLSGVSVSLKISLALLAGAFSPDMFFVLVRPSVKVARLLLITVAGFFTVFIIWPAVLYFYGDGIFSLKETIMPLSVALASATSGFLACFIADAILKIYPGEKELITVATMFLMYPFSEIIGTDFIFIAFGAGIYRAIFYERVKLDIGNPETGKLLYLCLAFVMVFFGTDMAIENFFILKSSYWLPVLITSFCIIGSRLAIAMFNRYSLINAVNGIYMPLLFGGPILIIILRRFIPGLEKVFHGNMDQFQIYAACNTTMAVVYLFAALSLSVSLYCYLRLKICDIYHFFFRKTDLR